MDYVYAYSRVDVDLRPILRQLYIYAFLWTIKSLFLTKSQSYDQASLAPGRTPFYETGPRPVIFYTTVLVKVFF